MYFFLFLDFYISALVQMHIQKDKILKKKEEKELNISLAKSMLFGFNGAMRCREQDFCALRIFGVFFFFAVVVIGVFLPPPFFFNSSRTRNFLLLLNQI